MFQVDKDEQGATLNDEKLIAADSNCPWSCDECECQSMCSAIKTGRLCVAGDRQDQRDIIWKSAKIN